MFPIQKLLHGYDFLCVCSWIIGNLQDTLGTIRIYLLVAEIHFSRWGAKPSKFPTKLSNFRQTPPPFALEKAVFSPLIGQNFQKFIIFHEGGGGGRPTEISATAHYHADSGEFPSKAGFW